MYKFIKEIEKDREDKRRSVLFSLNFNNERETLLKSMIPELASLTVSKKGSEIKSKLVLEVEKTKMAIVVVSQRLASLSNELTIAPNYFDSGETGFKYYGYSQIDNCSEDVAKKMREYNNLVFKDASLKKEFKYINTLIENIQDNKVYDLPVKTLSELGF